MICYWNKNLKHMTVTLGWDDGKEVQGPIGSFIKAIRTLRRQREKLLLEAGKYNRHLLCSSRQLVNTMIFSNMKDRKCT